MRAAIFDLDGTLADTSGDLIAAANETLRYAGIAACLSVGPDTGTALRGGRPMLRLGFERAGRPVDEIQVNALYPALLAHYEAKVAHHTRLYDGVEAALSRLAAGGWRLGICTNKPQGLADLLLDELGVADRFQAVLGADALPVRKPHPEHLTETIRRVGAKPHQAIMIGDTATDRDTARAAGVPCVLVGFGPEGAGVSALQPAAVLEHFDDLPALLEELLPPQPFPEAVNARAP